MKKIKFIALAALAFAAASCTKKEMPSEFDNIPAGMKQITIEVNNPTKANLLDDYSFEWESTDEVAVFDGTQINKFTVASCEGNTAVLEGTVVEGATEVTAVYPYSAASVAESALSVTIPSSQAIPAGKKIDPTALVCKGTAKVGESMSMTQSTSLVKFSVSKAVNKVTIVAGGTKTVTVQAAEGSLSGDYFATITPGEYKGLEVSAKAGNVIYGRSSSATANFTVGSGLDIKDVCSTELVPAEITTAKQFKAFLKYATLYTAEEVVSLGADIDCGSENLASATRFAGDFDGKNHKIYNLKVSATGNSTGLINELTGTFKNVIIGSSDGTAWDEVSVISGTGATGVIGRNQNLVQNVTNFATIKFNSNASKQKFGVGGIVGIMATNESKVIGCVTNSRFDASGNVGAETHFGGIVGQINCYNVEITSCVNNTNIEIGIPAKFVLFIGGILGKPYKSGGKSGVISECVNNGSVNYSDIEGSSTWVSVGGIAGGAFFAAEIDQCTNNGNISSSRIHVNRVGGIAGTLNTSGSVTRCTNTGSVSMIQTSANAQWQAVGGLVGFQEKAGGSYGDNAVISWNNNSGAVVCTANNTTTGAMGLAAGGIVGSSKDNTALSNNVNSGSVTMTNTGTTSQPVAAGGVVGFLYAATVTSSYDRSVATVAGSAATYTGAAAGFAQGKVSNAVIGGSVNGVTVTSDNLATLVNGSASTVAAEGTTLADPVTAM